MKSSAIVLVLLIALSSVTAWAEAPKLNVGGVDQAGGTVKGVVKFAGKQAVRKPIRTDTDKFCATAHTETPLLSEKYVFGDNDTLQNVFVYVSKGLEGKTFTAPATKAVLDQVGCQYVPHVQGVMAGQEFEIRNSDNTTHNVNCKASENESFNEAMAAAGMTMIKKFDAPEMALAFSCQVHPWMNGYLFVMSNPYYAVTQQDGTFEIKGLSAGDYEVSVWHEFDKFTPQAKSQPVKVEEGKTAELTFTYQPPQ